MARNSRTAVAAALNLVLVILFGSLVLVLWLLFAHPSSSYAINQKYREAFLEIGDRAVASSQYLDAAESYGDPELIKEAAAIRKQALMQWKEAKVVNARIRLVDNQERITELQKEFLVKIGEWQSE